MRFRRVVAVGLAIAVLGVMDTMPSAAAVPASVSVGGVYGDSFVNCGYAFVFGNYGSASYQSFMNYGSSSGCDFLVMALSTSAGGGGGGYSPLPNYTWIQTSGVGAFVSAQYFVSSTSAGCDYTFRFDSGGARNQNQC